MPFKRICSLGFLAVTLALLGWANTPAADETVSPDEELLKSEKVGTETADLVAYVHKQILTEEDTKQIQGLVKQLGSDKFDLRNQAVQKLQAIGPRAARFVRPALRSTDPEVKTRAEACLAELDKGPSSGLAAAAIRVLVQRRAAVALKLLLEYFPTAPDDSIEDEVLAGLAQLGVHGGQVDPLLLDAAKDNSPDKRAAAACVLGRAGNVEQRALVRQLLADPDARVRLYAGNGLLGPRLPRTADDNAGDDETLLQNAKLGTDPPALVAFFRRRTLHEADLKQVKQLIDQLGSDRFREREEASQKLIEFGPGALDSLRTALRNTNQEVVRRADVCIETITTNPGPALPCAALRVLARKPHGEAIKALLEYVPFADDARVEEEVGNALSLLSVREANVDEALVAALKDAKPARRSAAALVLGRVGDKESCLLVRGLLKDADPRVRLRAAQGLVCAKDKSAIDVLTALLADSPLEYGIQAESLLQQLAGDKAPNTSLADNAEQRKKTQEAWVAWWTNDGSKQDLPSLDQAGRQLGLTMVAELVGNNGVGNKVWEFGLDGKARWEMTNLQGPIDCQTLPGGHVLIAEHNGQLVSERDLHGKVVWQHKVNGNPVSCQRLPNGNTFIGTYNAVLEVTPAGKEVYQHNPNAGVGGVIYDACKLPSGSIVCISGRGTVTEIDTAGKKIATIQVQNGGGWGGVSGLPGGRFLVSVMNPGKVMEVNREGKILWEAAVQHACHAVRLPNGNTLVACMNNQKVVEINRAGKTVWEKTVTGRPFHVRRR